MFPSTPKYTTYFIFTKLQCTTASTHFPIQERLHISQIFFPSQAHTTCLIPSHLPGKQWEKGSGPALPPATHKILGGCEQPGNPIPWLQQPNGQRLLSIRRCPLLTPPAVMQTGKNKTKQKAVLKNKQPTSYCSTFLLRRPLCQVLSIQNNLFERNICQWWSAGLPKRKYYPELQSKGFLLNFV